MDERTFQVVYTWHGERHTLLSDFDTVREANAVCDEMRAARWNAWVEVTSDRSVSS